jgi:two-component system response regulator HydG
VNCAAIPSGLMESELFGHTKGAFTGAQIDRKGLFEEASGGTLFLDEIGDLHLSLQAKLLRVLQEKKIRRLGTAEELSINTRLIAATHRDLGKMIGEGTFREDLFFRLNIIPIHIPPLRSRPADIPLLVQEFIRQYSSKYGRNVKGITQVAMNQLLHKSWPGNVRELESVIERAIILGNAAYITPDDLDLESSNNTDLEDICSGLPTLAEIEHRYIKRVLRLTEFKKEPAARILGINRRTLYRKAICGEFDKY